MKPLPALVVFSVVSRLGRASLDHESGTSRLAGRGTIHYITRAPHRLRPDRSAGYSRFPSAGLTVSASGTHLFLDLHLPARPSPGTYSLRVDNGRAPDRPFHHRRAALTRRPLPGLLAR